MNKAHSSSPRRTVRLWKSRTGCIAQTVIQQYKGLRCRCSCHGALRLCRRICITLRSSRHRPCRTTYTLYTPALHSATPSSHFSGHPSHTLLCLLLSFLRPSRRPSSLRRRRHRRRRPLPTPSAFSSPWPPRRRRCRRRQTHSLAPDSTIRQRQPIPASRHGNMPMARPARANPVCRSQANSRLHRPPPARACLWRGRRAASPRANPRAAGPGCAAGVRPTRSEQRRSSPSPFHDPHPCRPRAAPLPPAPRRSGPDQRHAPQPQPPQHGRGSGT